MKKGHSSIFLGTLLLIALIILSYIHSGEIQGPMYLVNISIQKKNYSDIIFWLGIPVISFSNILIGVRQIIRSAYEYFTQEDKQNVKEKYKMQSIEDDYYENYIKQKTGQNNSR